MCFLNCVKVFPTELRDSGINFAAIAAKLAAMSAPYAIDLVITVFSLSLSASI